MNQPPYDSFLQTLRQVVEQRLDDPTLGVDDLCAAVHLSRAQVHRRLTGQTGLSATLYIRSVRLERAKELLEQTDLAVFEVAYAVGFQDAAYFSRVFGERYGRAPRDVRGGSKPSL